MPRPQAAAVMDANEFVRKWGPAGPASKLNERAGAQAHFIDLCRMLAVPEPADPESYCFERSFHRHNRALGYADVWKRGCFAWEYKAPGTPLDEALSQLMQYALPLENPPLLVVSDRRRFEIHTHFTGYASTCTTFEHGELLLPETRATLHAVFSDPYHFRPDCTSVEITKAAATDFAAMAERMQARGIAPGRSAHFLTQCLFCMFAQDVGLLKTDLLKTLTQNRHDGATLRRSLARLFKVMRTGGDFGVENIPWFNGGLFEKVDVPELTAEDVQALRAAASLTWRGLDPSIFGTLFERGLDPRKRRQLGAHYTDPETIAKLVIPVVERPLLTEWAELRTEIARLMEQRDVLRDDARKISSTTKPEQARHTRKRSAAKAAERQAQDLFNAYLQHLRDFRVLDPACGSGNFLYVALRTLKDIEHRVNLEAESLGLHRQLPLTGPQNLLGIEVDAYAAELSRVTVWIGELQWRMQHGFGWKMDPILDPLDQIECRDALLGAGGEEAAWPAADVVVGNPPFVGDKKMRGDLGNEYTEQLRQTFKGRVPGGADLVCYWLEKARAQVRSGGLKRAGLVSTNSVRGGANRQVLDAIVRDTRIFAAWSDEPWVNNGAAVRVSLVAFGDGARAVSLNGAPVASVNADLTEGGGGAPDLTTAQRLRQNADTCFEGIKKYGSFDIPGAVAREWLTRGTNPHGRANADVLAPWINAQDVARRASDSWVVDFSGHTHEQAALYELPFEHVRTTVAPERQHDRNRKTRDQWWLFERSRTEMRAATRDLSRYLVTPVVAKYRSFVWRSAPTLAMNVLDVVARADDTCFGILHSRFHELWSLRMCTWMGKGNDPRYTPTTCFETFPFPTGLTPADSTHQRTEPLPDGALIPAGLPGSVRPHAEAIARAAKRLTDLRDAWLNPPEWIERVPEVVPLGMTHSPYPDRILAKAGFEKELAKRTLTNLYNQRPTWLSQAHEALDVAVAAAYGWDDYSATMPGEEILRRLLAENLQRAQRQAGAQLEMPLLGVIARSEKAAAKSDAARKVTRAPQPSKRRA